MKELILISLSFTYLIQCKHKLLKEIVFGADPLYRRDENLPPPPSFESLNQTLNGNLRYPHITPIRLDTQYQKAINWEPPMFYTQPIMRPNNIVQGQNLVTGNYGNYLVNPGNNNAFSRNINPSSTFIDSNSFHYDPIISELQNRISQVKAKANYLRGENNYVTPNYNSFSQSKSLLGNEEPMNLMPKRTHRYTNEHQEFNYPNIDDNRLYSHLYNTDPNFNYPENKIETHDNTEKDFKDILYYLHHHDQIPNEKEREERIITEKNDDSRIYHYPFYHDHHSYDFGNHHDHTLEDEQTDMANNNLHWHSNSAAYHYLMDTQPGNSLVSRHHYTSYTVNKFYKIKELMEDYVEKISKVDVDDKNRVIVKQMLNIIENVWDKIDVIQKTIDDDTRKEDDPRNKPIDNIEDLEVANKEQEPKAKESDESIAKKDIIQKQEEIQELEKATKRFDEMFQTNTDKLKSIAVELAPSVERPLNPSIENVVSEPKKKLKRKRVSLASKIHSNKPRFKKSSTRNAPPASSTPSRESDEETREMMKSLMKEEKQMEANLEEFNEIVNSINSAISEREKSYLAESELEKDSSIDTRTSEIQGDLNELRNSLSQEFSKSKKLATELENNLNEDLTKIRRDRKSISQGKPYQRNLLFEQIRFKSISDKIDNLKSAFKNVSNISNYTLIPSTISSMFKNGKSVILRPNDFIERSRQELQKIFESNEEPQLYEHPHSFHENITNPLSNISDIESLLKNFKANLADTNDMISKNIKDILQNLFIVNHLVDDKEKKMIANNITLLKNSSICGEEKYNSITSFLENLIELLNGKLQFENLISANFENKNGAVEPFDNEALDLMNEHLREKTKGMILSLQETLREINLIWKYDHKVFSRGC